LSTKNFGGVVTANDLYLSIVIHVRNCGADCIERKSHVIYKNFYFKAKMTASQNNAVLRFVKLTENALTAKRGSSRSAGLDLRSAYDTTVPARGKVLVSTDF